MFSYSQSDVWSSVSSLMPAMRDFFLVGDGEIQGSGKFFQDDGSDVDGEIKK